MKKITMFRVGISLIPILILVTLLALNISIFGSDAILGASQVALLFSAGVAIWLAMWLFKVPWQDFEETIKSNIGDVTTAIVILFLIGAISGTWTVSGIVPTFIYYGVKIISPKVFLLTACIICALVSVTIGSSWTTIATIGVALLGIGKALGFSDGMIAGAIISGAYFGDKISPLSDTTVLASSMSKVPMFDHIRYLMYTTVPSIVITLVIFTILGFSHSGSDSSLINEYTSVLDSKFNITPWLLIVPALTAVMIARRMPALIVLALSTATAAIAAVIFQPDIIREIGASIAGDGSNAKILFTGTIESIYNSVSIETGNPEVNQLVASKGMLGMLNTVYLIICAMCFGAALKASGMLRHLASMILPLTKRRTSLVTSTVVTGTALNGIVSDQYLAIILTSSLFKDVYEKEGYENRLLSRSVEDSATVTSPLYPWSSCGMTQATILSVPTLAYLPYCFFNLISPLMSITVAAIGYKILKKDK
ncbi:MAG: Na+/H+ antiporter NhaC family protein [Bacteroidales bacterium]|jgi:NhaC family Na+:H+ antiporter|uniref:Na+/H+ antiporter NhaC family protein n=1 Tax=Candidatus Cryptobacteroides bacterium TaxID=3085639 RepID=UPI002EA35106|nr:sodium:proton antiporter [Alistipes sp.]MEE1407136.1 Na+/H+ antiporter NhaC family protein [Bacteroidales bacterium]